MPVTIASCFNVGEIVLVNDLLKAWILEIFENETNITFTLKYMLSGLIEYNVPLQNISVIEIYSNEVSTTRSGFTRTSNSQPEYPNQSASTNINDTNNDSSRVSILPSSTQDNSRQSTNNENNDSEVEETDDSNELKQLKDALVALYHNKSYTNRSNLKI